MILSTDGRTDGWTDGRTDDMKPVYPLFNFVEVGGIINKPGAGVTNAKKLLAESMAVIGWC